MSIKNSNVNHRTEKIGTKLRTRSTHMNFGTFSKENTVNKVCEMCQIGDRENLEHIYCSIVILKLEHNSVRDDSIEHVTSKVKQIVFC